jgi:hypothetical protein
MFLKLLPTINNCKQKFFKGGFFGFVMYFIPEHCFICRPSPSDSTASEDAGIEPWTVAISALAAYLLRCGSNHSARSQSSHPDKRVTYMATFATPHKSFFMIFNEESICEDEYLRVEDVLMDFMLSSPKIKKPYPWHCHLHFACKTYASMWKIAQIKPTS